MKNRKGKLINICQLSLCELCFLVLIISITLVLWYPLKSNDDGKESKTISDTPLTVSPSKVSGIRNKKYERKYLNYTEYPTIIYWNRIVNFKSHYLIECGELICDVHRANSRKMLPPNNEGAYIFYASSVDFNNLPLPRNPQKVIWALLHEESPKNVAELAHEKGLNIFNFSSTFSRYSDVPFPLQHIKSLEHITDKKYFIKTSVKNLALRELSPILYIQSICDSITERDEYVKELMKYQRVDSYGACLKNKHSPNYSKRNGYDYLNKLWDEDLLKFIAQYKFVVTIENGICEDYVSEKLWRAIHVGVVPIYFGSPSIIDWLPNEKSAILLKDFPKPKLLSQHINKLMEDDEMYEEYLEHKTMGKISNQHLIEELRTRPYQTNRIMVHRQLLCFLCEKLHEKDKGVHIVNTSHYNCSKPVSALSQKAELNSWLGTWEYGKKNANTLYNFIMQS